MPSLLAVNNYFYLRGGAESVFFEEMQLLKDLGWDIVPFSMLDEKNVESTWSRYFVNSLEFENVHTVTQKLSAAAKIIYSHEAKRKLKKLLTDIQPDICHLHNIYHHLSPSILPVLKQHGIPTVMTLHDLKIACPAYRMLNRNGICEQCQGGKNYNVLVNKCIKDSLLGSAVIMVESYLHLWIKSYIKGVDRFIVPSKFYLDKFVEWGFPREKFRYVPNFVDTDAFQYNSTAGNYFFYFGRLSFEKGVGTLVKAAIKANIKLKIAGIGPDKDAIEAIAEGKENIQFLGFLRGGALHKAIGESRAIVLPSEWYENAPISVMEAYAMARPVIGADIGGIPELVKHDETGFCFPSGDVQRLTDILIYVEQESDKRVVEMGMRGRRWMEAEYSRSEHFRLLNKVYREVGTVV